jgi:hypothetical protein
MKSHHLSLSLTVLTCLLASCSSTRTCGNSHPYLANSARPPLQAPAGVTLPKPDPAYLVPGAATHSPASRGPAGTATTPCLVEPPSVLTKEDMSRAPTPILKPSAHPGAAPPPPPHTPPPRVAAKRGME